ncbi:Transmembrane protein 184-like protein [Paramyrothecium foliicola]|nr:Transmembrane protein 184-like protein [Paramyrothecium foliicola]
MIWVAVFQFCIVKFLGALAKCITEAADVYCADTRSTQHSRTYIFAIEIVSLVSAMMMLLQFYKQTKEGIAQHRPLFKFIAIKLVVAVFYLQNFIFSQLTTEGGALQPNELISYPSLAVGIPSTLLCFEMMLVAVLHIWAYPVTPYQQNNEPKKSTEPRLQSLSLRHEQTTYPEEFSQHHHRSLSTNAYAETTGICRSADTYDDDTAMNSHLRSQGGFLGWKAIVDAINILDVIVGVCNGIHWLIVGRKQMRARSSLGMQLQMTDDENLNQPSSERPIKTSDIVEAMEM